MLVDIFNKVTALVCAMQVPSLNIVNINVKLEKPSHPWAGQVSRSKEQSPGEQENQMSAFFGKCILEKTHFKTSFILTLEAQK